MAQQTAVEWLSERLIRMIPTISPIYKYDIKEYVEQAKAMEKEQIMKAASTVLWNNSSNSRKESEQYYNETFNK
jgi:tartrate dehydratase alpha subunit/fumarate hydratase class I-like protein